MKFGFLAKHFPSPQFLKPPHIGLSFSDTNIKAIFLNNQSKNPNLKSIIVPLENNLIVNGSITNMEGVVEKLSIIKKNFNIPFVFFTIPDELVYLFPASVPVSSKGDLTESISFIMEENVPLALNDTVFDYQPIKMIQSESEYKASVVVSACLKREVEKFLETLHRSDLYPVGCIHESQAIARSVIPKKLSEISCLIHAKEKRIGIHLVKNGIVHFSTIRNISSKDYSAEFLDEFEKFIEYCSKYDVCQNLSIKTFFACGDFEYAKKIIEIINTDSRAKNVTLSNVWTNAFGIDKYVPDIPYEKSLSFAGPVGAALLNLSL